MAVVAMIKYALNVLRQASTHIQRQSSMQYRSWMQYCLWLCFWHMNETKGRAPSGSPIWGCCQSSQAVLG